MRLKTVPRQMRVDYLARPSVRKDNTSSTSHTQDATSDNNFVDIDEYSRLLEYNKEVGIKPKNVSEKSSEEQQLNTEICNEQIDHFVDPKNLSEETFEAVDLTTKDAFGNGVEEKILPDASSTLDRTDDNNEFVGSMLYQIMTDPKFVENIQSQREMKRSTCKFCRQQFRSTNELQDHMEFHQDECNRITCCACGKSFAQKRYLRYHQRCHVDKNKFSCSICTKKYSRLDNLTRHTAYHTNPNKYPCQICGKTFSRRDLMTKHQRCHEPKKSNSDNLKAEIIDAAKMNDHEVDSHMENKKT